MNDVFLVEIDVRLTGRHHLADDEITDLIEAVVDHLDRLAIDPSVGTRRNDHDVELTVGVTVDEGEEFDALSLGVAVIKAGLHSAGIGTSLPIEPHDLRSRVLSLQHTR